MKKLWVVRHAKSSHKDGSIKDFDRPLNDRGVLSAHFMGKLLKASRHAPDMIVASPANRAKSTAEIISKEIDFNEAITFNKNIYGADTATLLQVINGFNDEWDHVFLFGHNPGMSAIVDYLTGEYCPMVTCAVAEISLGVDTWKECSLGVGSLIKYDYPKKHTAFIEQLNEH